MTKATPEPPRDIYYTGDTIKFSGFDWVIKDSKNKITGPGKNYFSNSKENVWVDSLGKLHLKIAQRNEKWYASEVRLTNNLGYGRYIFYIDKLPQGLDKDMVIGLFTYDHFDTSNYHKEIDIEFSKWGKEKNANSQYVIQPYESTPHRFDTDLNYATKHYIEVRKRKIHFSSFYDSDLLPDSVDRTIQKWSYKPEEVYRTSHEKVSINVWLYKSTETASLKDVEVIISRFEFVPFKLEKHKPVIPKIKLFNRSKDKD
ncbi:MAG: hypothetical protein KA444_10445 [Bacteroidia bacterium]|nr:hypothetical protein [Bacteroidia bacterium]